MANTNTTSTAAQGKATSSIDRLKEIYTAMPASKRAHYAGLVQKVLAKSAGAYQNNYNSLVKSYQEENGISGFRSQQDTAAFRDRATASANRLRAQREQYTKLMDIFGNDMDAGFRTQFSDMLNGTDTAASQILDYANNRHDFYSQFKDEDEYKTYQDMMGHWTAAQGKGYNTMQWYDAAKQRKDEAYDRYNKLKDSAGSQTYWDAMDAYNALETEKERYLNTPGLTTEERDAYLADYEKRRRAAMDAIDAAQAGDKQAAEDAAKAYRDATLDYNYAEAMRYGDLKTDAKSVDVGKAQYDLDYEEYQEKVAEERAQKEADYYNMPGAGGAGVGAMYVESPIDTYRWEDSYRRPRDDWSEDEKNRFYSIYANDKDAAFEYAIKLNKGYNEQAREKAKQDSAVYQWMERREGDTLHNILSGAAGYAMGVITAPEKLGEFLDMSQELAGRGVVMNAPTGNLGDLADAMIERRTSELNEKGVVDIPLIGEHGWGDVYQLGESIAQSMSYRAIGGEYGAALSSVVFFGTAAKEGLETALASGADPNRAWWYAMWSGLNEAAFEYFSIDKLIKMKDGKTLAQFFKNIIVQAGIEGSEEFNTTLANTIAQAIVMGDKSELNQNILKYVESGMSYEDAKKLAWKEWSQGILSDFVGGAISGGISGGAEQIGGYAKDAFTPYTRDAASRYQKTGMNAEAAQEAALADRQSLFDTASGLKGTNAAAYGSRLQQRTQETNRRGQAKDITVRQAQKLGQLNADALTASDIANTTKAVQKRLADFGIQDEKLAQAITATALQSEAERIGARGFGVTREQRAMVEESGVAKVILSEMDVQNLRNEQKAYALRNALEDSGASQEELDSLTDPFYRGNEWVKKMKANKALAADVYGSQADITQEEINSVTVDGKEAKIVGKNNGKILVEQDGKVKAVGIGSLANMSRGVEMLLRAAPSGDGGAAFLRLHKPGQNVGEYAQAWYTAQEMYGAQTNLSFDEVRAKTSMKVLTDNQLRAALEIGRKSYDASKADAEKRGKAFQEAREKAAKSGAEQRKRGTVNLNGGEVNGRKYKGVSEKNLTDAQRHVLAMVRGMADVVNINFVVYDGDPNEGGSYIKGGTVMININSGKYAGRIIGAASLAHEMTHFIQEFAPEEYQALKDFIVSEILKKSEAEFNRLVKIQMDLEPGITKDEAVDELIANACQKMLLNSKAIERLARKNLTVAEKIRNWIGDMRKKFSKAYEDVDLNDDISVYEAARAIDDFMEQAQDAWDKGLEAAAENISAAKATGMKAEDGGQRQAFKTEHKDLFEKDKYFDRQVDKWNDLKDGTRVKVGVLKEGSALNKVGFPATGMWFDVGKIRKSFGKHEDHLTKGILKSIPAMLNSPVAITEYRGPRGDIDNTVTVYGLLMPDGKTPIAVGVMMAKHPNGETIINKIRTVHARGDAIINDQNILYLNEDKKRTRDWFHGCGISVPLVGTKFGLIRSIQYIGKKSKSQNQQFQKLGIGETAEEQQARKESFDNLKAENKILRERAEYWKAQTRTTKERTVRQQDTDRLANELLRKYNSKADREDIKSAIKELGDWLVQTDELDYDELRDKAEAIAEDIISGNYTLLDNSQQEQLDRLKDYLKSTPVNLTKSDFNDTGDEGFRKKYGRYFTVSENGRTIDSLWGEMAAMFGEGIFPEDTYAPGDMLNMIADYLDLWKPQYGNEFEMFHDEAVDAAANELIDAILSEEVRQTPGTFADKEQQKLNAQIVKDRAKLDALREAKNARIAELQRQAAEKNKQIRLAEKALKYEAVSKVKKHYQDMIKKQRNKRSDTSVRGKIRALHKELTDILLKPKEGRYVPKELVKATAEILGAIDTTSGRAIKAKAAFAELKVKYEELAKNDKYALAYDETIGEMIQKLAESMGDGSIYDLTGTELENVYDVLKALKYTIVTANKLVGSKIEADAFDAANQWMREIENAKGIPTKALRKFVMAQMTPSLFFRMAGGYVKDSMSEQLFNELNNGQLTQTQILMEGGMIFRELIDDKKNMDKLHDKKNLVDIGLKDDMGNTVKITRGMMLSVYMHLLNEQNAKHVAYGGFTVPKIREYYANKMKDAYSGKTGRTVAFAAEIAELNEQLRNAESVEKQEEIKEKLADLQDQTDAYMSNLRSQIEEQLTEYDRKWIAAAQQFFDVFSKDKLNEVTEMVYGFSKARVDNYFPIHTDPNYRAASFDTIARDMSLENAGFMKERVNGAKPIRLEDITDVISSQLRRTAQYVGLMPAIRNFNKVYGKARAGYTMSVQSAMNRTFENEGKNYIENLLADLNGARHQDADIFDMLRGNMAGAVLTLNPRVALSQTASYPTAAAEIGYKPLIKALKDIKNNPSWSETARDEVAKWTPLWWYRMQGFSTVELGDIKNNEQFMSKVMDKMKWATGWIQFMDGMTTGALWQASKYYVDDNFSDLEKGSDEYMMKVAEVYNRVIEKTQPDYTTMQRPDILRNPKKHYKQLTMFMTQRLQNMNILYDAAATYSHYASDLRAGRNDVTAADVKQARTRLVWAASSQVAASATIVIFKALADFIMHNLNAYRDDDDELTAESVSKTLLANFAETIISNMLWGSELYSALKSIVTGDRYYGISLNGVDTFKDLLEDGVKTLSKVWKGDWENAAAPAWKLAKAVAQFFGVPLGNMEKIAKMSANYIEDAKNGTFMEAGVDRTRAQNTHILFDALQRGDTAKASRIRAEFKDKKDEQAALKGYIKEMYTDENQKINKAETVIYLQKYCGMTKRDAESLAQKWTMEVVTGIKYDDLKDEFLEGRVQRASAEKYLKAYGGLDTDEAAAKVTEWLSEKETGIAYSDIGNEVKTGRLSEEKAIQMLMKYGGKSEDAATKTVNGYAIEREYEIKPSELEEEYLAGNVGDREATDILLRYKYYGKENAAEKAAEELERMRFVKANPDAADMSITQVRNYKASDLSGVISAADYLQAAKMMGTFSGEDKNGDGKTDRNSVVKQKLAYIDTLNITKEQKTALATALGISERTIRKYAAWRK